MALAPEVFGPLEHALNTYYRGKQCSKAECGNNWLALFFRSGSQCLFICWHDLYPGFCLATAAEIANLKSTETRTPPFREAVKKHIENCHLNEIARIRNDRIISLRFSRIIGAGFDTYKSLVAELTGKRSNLHLLIEDGTILESGRHVSAGGGITGGNRTGSTYSPPPPFKGIDPGKFHGPALFFLLDSLSGYGSKVAASLNENWHLFTLEKWQKYLRNTFEPGIFPGKSITIMQSLGNTLSAFPVPLGNALVHEGNCLEILRGDVILPLLSDRMNSIKKNLINNTKKRSEKLASIRKGIENQIMESAKAQEYKAAGDLLLTYQHRVPKGADSVTLPYWKGEAFEEMRIDLDPSKSLSDNAQSYFRKFRKFNVDRGELNRKLEEIFLEELEITSIYDRIETLDNFHSLAELAPQIHSRPHQQTKKPSHGPVKVYEFMGHQVIAGTNSKANRKVTFIFAAEDDLWFHARGMPGGHVILKDLSGTEAGGIILEFAASLAAYFSKASNALKVSVDYTRRKYVRSIPGSIAEVTYSRARTLTVSPDLWKRLLSKNQQAPGEAGP